VQKVSVIDFLISEFGTISTEELGKAVKMVLAEKLETSKDVATSRSNLLAGGEQSSPRGLSTGESSRNGLSRLISTGQ
jgi:hypothetical protein